MNILGVTAPVSWNNAAALVQDGRLVAAAEEERFVRVKQAPRMPAVNSARFCIRQAGIEARDVDVIAVGFKGPFEYTRRQFATHFRHAEWRNAALSFASGAEYAIQQYKLKRAMEAAELLRDGAIVGWFQGRMELGPRALGARSILAHPGIAEMKDRVNAEVKHREGWRPFAPSILEEEAAALVEDACPAPFMLLTFTGSTGSTGVAGTADSGHACRRDGADSDSVGAHERALSPADRALP